jgi:hypothetical protein
LQKQKHYLVRGFNCTFKTLGFTTLKFVITGTGKVGNGAKEILDAIKIKEVSVENYLTKLYTVYTQIDVLDYNKRKTDKYWILMTLR